MKLIISKRLLASFACCVLLSLSHVALANEQAIDEANRLDALVTRLYSQGRYEEAIPQAKRALEITESIYGENHLNVATTLNNIAQLYSVSGRFMEAESSYKRSIQICENALGADHEEVTKSLNNLALLYRSTGKFNDAEKLLKRSMEIIKNKWGSEHPVYALLLNNLALTYDAMGRYGDAEPLYNNSLEIRKKTSGEDSLDVAINLNNLASLYLATGRYAKAELFYIRALTRMKKHLGENHPDVATTLNNLAGVYSLSGSYDKSEDLNRKALMIREISLGKDHPDVATSLNNIAGVYQNTGRHSDAIPLYKRSIEIAEKVFGNNHPSVALALNNLAGIYQSSGKYAEAEELYKRALSILGENNPGFALSLSNLASVYHRVHRYSEAAQLYKKSLTISEKVHGENHPDVALTLNNLAGVYFDMDKQIEAELSFKRALSIWEKALGNNHPNVATGFSNLSGLYAANGKHHESNTAFKKATSIQEDNREVAFQILSEKQKINYLSQQEGTIHAFITHTAQSMASSPVAIADTFNAWLRWKGSVAEAQGRYQEAVSRSTDPQIQSKFDELINIRRELGSLRLSKPEKLSFSNYQLAMDRLEKQKEVLEAALSRLSKDFTLDKNAGRADLKNLTAILPKDSIYLDFAKIKVHDFKKAVRGEERYFAFILIPQKNPVVKLVEIADAKSLDQLISDYHREMNRIKTHGVIPDQNAINKSTKAIYGVLFRQLEQYTVGKKNLIISPDGALNLIPFEILTPPDGKHLIEKYTISYVGAGRDIVRFSDTATTAATALIMADPDYNLGQNEKQQIAVQMKVASGVHGNVTRDASRLSFTPLPDTKQEADAISKVLSSSMNLAVHNYQNNKALEDVLFTGAPPRIMHLATHGYFLSDEENKGSSTSTRGLVIKEKAGLGYDYFVKIENPMLRSGIALAGVNSSLKEGRDDGLVSAEKILGLRLKGTDLVVLSACETGVGDVKNGEGVFGLKRAFFLSGAKSLVMSLWSVPNTETTELMTDFYTLMAAGNSKTDALREAKLNMMKKKPNPFYWGAFVLTGKPN
jgi:CHAT domain-containing protein/Tfp pilus assembly protein PilF